MSMQRKFEFIEAKIDCNRNYSLKDTFKFELKMLFHEPVENDLEFEIIYFIYKDRRTIEDYSLGKFKIFSDKKGEVVFDLESSPIDISKIPIRTLFGLTSFLLSGRYQNKEFVRVGYVVNVGYHGLSDRELDVINEKENPEDMIDDVEEDDEYEGDDKEEYEMIENDENDENDEKEEENNEEDQDEEDNEEDQDEEDQDEEDNEEDQDEDNEEDQDEEDNDEEDNGTSSDYENEMSSEYDNGEEKEKDGEIEERYIDPNVDEFKFADKEMKQSLIELKLLENPIIQLFDIDAMDNTKVDVEEEELVESSDTDVSENNNIHKKPKLNE